MSQDRPITVNSVVKWAGIAFSIASTLITLVWFAASIKSEITSLRQEQAANKVEMTIKIDSQGKEIERLKVHSDETDKYINDMSRKLDVAVAILERIEKQISK